MKILAVGGGSGGHVTPVVAVLREVRKSHPKAEVRFWCDKYFASQARDIMTGYDASIRTQTVIAGKFRRYRHLTRMQHLTSLSIVLPNIRDTLFVLAGTVQSFIRLLMWRPDVVFAKGGYVCLPVGWAAWVLRIPIVIHDSDAHPGLTNRLLAPIAKHIATGAPLEHYNYPSEKSTYVGIPVDAAYKKLSEKQRREMKTRLGFDPKRPLLVCFGGGQGSRQINEAVAINLQSLLERTNVVLLSGVSHYDELVSLTPQDDPRFMLKDFMPQGLAELLGAADVVVSRAGATALLELASLARPTILVPSKRLTWQMKHAQLFVDAEAVLPLDEDRFTEPDDRSLVDAVQRILDDTTLQEKLSSNLHKQARPHAARDMANIIVRASRK